MGAFEILSLIFSISGLIEKLLMDCNKKVHISTVNKWVLEKKNVNRLPTGTTEMTGKE